MVKDRILIVDDEKDLLTGIARTLRRDMKNLEVVTASSAGQALEIFAEESFDSALVDICMPEMDGLQLLERLKKTDPQLTVVIMTAFGSIETAVDAIRKGAYDFITKPFEKDALLRVVKKALERNRLIRENIDLKQRVCESESLGNFIGSSEPMRKFYETLKTVSRSDYTVLVRGRSGTGKELAGRAIHSLSKRRNKPFVVVNCPAIPENLLESELFGHKQGAFTGADQDKTGLFEEADGGTICLDEIADIPVSVQIKLLRVLQEQEIKPLGANKTKKINVRIIAMTNQDLEEKISQRTFREDLFYRLNVVTLNTLPLHEINEDIPLLVSHFAKQVCCELDLEVKKFSQEALEHLKQRDWPGNVRELQNMVRRTIIFCSGNVIEVEDLPDYDNAASSRQKKEIPLLSESGIIEPYKESKEKVIKEFTDTYLSALLSAAGGNVTKAAQISGLTRAALQKILRRSDIKPDFFRSKNEM